VLLYLEPNYRFARLTFSCYQLDSQQQQCSPLLFDVEIPLLQVLRIGRRVLTAYITDGHGAVIGRYSKPVGIEVD
jgi:hypothetical protein